MQRYKIFAAVFLIGSYSLAAFSYLGNRQDAVEDNKLTGLYETNDDVQSFISKNERLPDSPTEVKLSKDITYEKHSDNVYLLCTTFEEKYTPPAGGYDSTLIAEEQEVVDRAIADLKAKDSQTNYIASGEYFDGYSAAREKGKNCYVFYDAVGTVDYIGCGGLADSYNIQAFLTVESVDTATKTVTFKPSFQEVTDLGGESVESPQILSKNYNDESKFCDFEGIEVEADYFGEGDPVAVYLSDIQGQTILRMESR